MSRLIPVAAILIALGLFFGYINPTITGPIAETKQKIKEYENALAAAKRFSEKLDQLDTERKAIPAESIVRLESLLPNGVDNVQLILDIDGLASRTGLVLSDFSTTEPEDREEQTISSGIQISNQAAVDSIELSTSAVGTYSEFRTFLASAEHSLRPLDLINLSVSTGEKGNYVYDMTFRLYWLR